MAVTPTFIRAPAGSRFWQLAVFDLDGTLVNTQEDLLESLAQAIGPEAFDTPAHARAQAALHLGMQAMAFAALGDGQKDPNRLRALEARFIETYSARIASKSTVYPGVTHTLHWLADRGIRLAVCSNKPIAMSRLLLEALNLTRWFPIVVGPESTGWPKPHPEPLRYAAWESNVPRSRTVLIGDSAIDLKCAISAGMDCWLYRGGYDSLAAAQAPLNFDHFEELCQPEYWPIATPRHRSHAP
jgi:phosphoglycolate phosphatase